MLFDVRVRRVEGRTVLAVVGDVDLASLPRFAAEVSRLEGDTTVDLTGVDWFDPICLGVLFAAALRVRRSGHVVDVVASERVLELLTELRLDEVIDVASERRT